MIVFRKEMIDLLRDRRSVFAMIVFPIVIQPILLFGMARMDEYGKKKLSNQEIRVAIDGGLAELSDRILADSLVKRVEVGDMRAAVRDGDVDIALVLPERLPDPGKAAVTMVLLYDESRDLSRKASSLIATTVDNWVSEIREERLESLSLPPLSFYLPLTETNLANEESMRGANLGKIAAFLIVFLLLNGASFAAVDLFAGERERKTIETILTSLVGRGSVVAGKFATVVVAALTATLLFLISTVLLSKFGWIGSESLRKGMEVSVSSAVVVFLVSLPLAFLISAILVLISSHARSFREAQTLLLPALLLGLIPSAVSLHPGIHLESIFCIVPIANVALAVRNVLVGNTPVFFLFLVVASNALYASLILREARNFFASEEMILGSGGRPAERKWLGDRLTTRAVMVFYAFELLVLYYIGSMVQARSLIPGLMLTLWAFLLIPTLLFARAKGVSFRRTLRFRPASLSHILGALLLTPACITAAHALFGLQSLVMPAPVELSEMLSELLGDGEGGVAILLFAVALSPGICEEVLFRGLLLGQFRKSMPPAKAVILSGLLFGLFHLSIYRILPTMLLGTAAGILVVISGSILPAMALHFLYDAILVLSSRWEALHIIDGYSWQWLGISAVCFACALALLRRRGGEARTEGSNNAPGRPF